MEKELKPLFKKVIFQKLDNPYVESKTDSGVYIPNAHMSSDSGLVEDAEEMIIYGEVVEIGDQCTEVKIGDGIFVSKMSALWIPFMDQGFMLVDELNIMSLIR